MPYEVFYWPLPFRGNFVRVLLKYLNLPFSEGSIEEIRKLRAEKPADQPTPSMAPPYLRDTESGLFLSQTVAIMQYIGVKHGCAPEDPFRSALALKVVLDVNDVLVEITNSNGNKMWDRESWKEFRGNRIPRWLSIFEEIGKKNGLTADSGFILGDKFTYADAAILVLWETMAYCLPQLKPDIEKNAPFMWALCERLAAQEHVAKYLEEQRKEKGQLYCSGHIEKSIRSMLEEDEKEAASPAV